MCLRGGWIVESNQSAVFALVSFPLQELVSSFLKIECQTILCCTGQRRSHQNVILGSLSTGTVFVD